MRKSGVAIESCIGENSPRHLGERQIRSFFLSFFEKKKENPNNKSFAQYWTTLIFRAEYPYIANIISGLDIACTLGKPIRMSHTVERRYNESLWKEVLGQNKRFSLPQ